MQPSPVVEADLSLYPVWGPTRATKPDRLVIDIHSHLSVPASVEVARGHFDPEDDPRFRFDRPESTAYNRIVREKIEPKFVDPEVRIRDMDDMGIDVQALAIVPSQYFYWVEPATAIRVSAMQNDRIAEVVAERPRRFVGLGSLPLRSVSAAVVELRRIVDEYGFPGISISTNVQGEDFDHPRFAPLWEAAEALEALVVLHPYGFTDAQRLAEYYLNNVVGLPLESTIALSRMILGGVLARHPGLKLLVVHGGGYLPFYFERTDHAYRHRPELRRHIDRPPSEYLALVHFDTSVHAPNAVAHLVHHFGSERVLLGSDYPFDMGVTDPLSLIGGAEGLTAADRVRITSSNAARLLGLET